eukprot:364857-Chlamydomonas_euryale.AAC.8
MPGPVGPEHMRMWVWGQAMPEGVGRLSAWGVGFRIAHKAIAHLDVEAAPVDEVPEVVELRQPPADELVHVALDHAHWHREAQHIGQAAGAEERRVHEQRLGAQHAVAFGVREQFGGVSQVAHVAVGEHRDGQRGLHAANGLPVGTDLGRVLPGGGERAGEGASCGMFVWRGGGALFNVSVNHTLLNVRPVAGSGYCSAVDTGLSLDNGAS